MKKSLVLAMAMALGVTASAYAANPFSDVPAGHWAYDSISKLAAAGVIEGYAPLFPFLKVKSGEEWVKR